MNRTPGASVVVTAWAPKRLLIAGTFLLAIVGFVLIIFVRPLSAPSNLGVSKELATIVFSGQTIKTEVVRSDVDKQQGLGGRDEIGDPGAMLFVYERPTIACFWMKDMRFSIDIIWIDAGKRIVGIKENVSPDTYPESFCQKEQVQYVLELPAGKSQELDLGIGTQLKF